MKVYITKYALTQGIQEEEARTSHIDSMVSVGKWNHYHGNDWHRDFDSAKQRAEQMRINKIESVRKSLKKLENMIF